MAMKASALLALVIILAAVHVESATITPATPASQDVITADIQVFGSTSYGAPSTVVSGNMIRTDLPVLGVDAFPGPDKHIFVSFGPLQPGTYTYQVFFVIDGVPALLSQQTIVVAPAVPALNEVYLSLLAISLAAAGSFALDGCR